MVTHQLGIIMHGITGRMGLNQHLKRSIGAIVNDGGVKLSNGDTIMPDPLLLGRNEEKLKVIAEDNGIGQFTSDYNVVVNSDNHTVFFDSGSTLMRPELLTKAIEAGKHIYCEKPVGASLEDAKKFVELADAKDLKSGVVMDKLFLPGLIKLRDLVDNCFFGKILTVKIDFGYWVFSGEDVEMNRPSWNYRKKEGGGIIFDMMSHWRYVLDHIFGRVQSVSCLGVNHIQQRWNEQREPYNADADDAAYATLQLENGIVAQINSSWCTRVNRDDLVTFQVDGTEGSAVAGLSWCKTQTLGDTPRPVWNPDEPQTMQFHEHWNDYMPDEQYPNGFRSQWEQFIRYIYDDAPWPYTLREGLKGVELAESAIRSWDERKWIDINTV